MILKQVFFVLRKKQSHISFLHVYHHTKMVITCWLHMRFYKSNYKVFITNVLFIRLLGSIKVVKGPTNFTSPFVFLRWTPWVRYLISAYLIICSITVIKRYIYEILDHENLEAHFSRALCKPSSIKFVCIGNIYLTVKSIHKCVTKLGFLITIIK